MVQYHTLVLGSLAAIAPLAAALPNGLGATPAMGYSSWNDCGSMRNNGPTGWCWDTEAHIQNVTEYLISSGLAKLGYVRINIDEGWLKGRDKATGKMVEDTEKFPSGMKGMGDWIKQHDTYAGSGEKMHYGLYSCRGTVQCGSKTYSAVGSYGHEAADVDWMVAAGADYLKIDSCGATNYTHAGSFAQYAKFRDAMNATGKQVWFSLCGWHHWYSPPDPSIGYKGGASLGNSWRIAGDGKTWPDLTQCMNTQAAVASYNGPGGWSDPDLLVGPEVYIGGQTDAQARAQFTMWSLFPANLLISQNVLAWTPYALETYSNEELVAINQDPLGSPAKRIVGGDLTFPCHSTHAAPCNSTNVWGRELSGGKFALGFVNNADSAAKITCDGSCFDALNISSSVAALKVRDLWAHADVATLTRPFTFTAAVNGSGFAAAYKLTPSTVIHG